MGGLAVRAHLIPRPTNDVDLTVSIEREKLPNWFEELEKRGVTVPDAVDVFLAESDFQASVLSRKVQAIFEGK